MVGELSALDAHIEAHRPPVDLRSTTLVHRRWCGLGYGAESLQRRELRSRPGRITRSPVQGVDRAVGSHAKDILGRAEQLAGCGCSSGSHRRDGVG